MCSTSSELGDLAWAIIAKWPNDLPVTSDAGGAESEIMNNSEAAANPRLFPAAFSARLFAAVVK
jgi:hypothetical protein